MLITAICIVFSKVIMKGTEVINNSDIIERATNLITLTQTVILYSQLATNKLNHGIQLFA